MADFLPNEELLMKYLDNELSASERAALEEHLKEDEQLRQRLETLRLAKESVRYNELQNKVSNVRPQMGRNTKNVSPNRGWLYVLAAACLLAVIIGIGIFLRNSLSADKVYEEAYVQYSLDRSRSQKQEYTPVENAYQSQNYTEVIRLSQQGKHSAKEALLTGISYLNVNQPEKAMPYFEQIRQDSVDTTYRQDGEFYLGLAFLKAKQYDKSLELLRKIQSDPNHLYHPLVSEKVIHDVEKLR
ncbi:MAG TPA: zf-HC2 domain-containing protein [Flavisolibacter sp.]|nr:zf-HC2 domain-containing protein [Flavisolibacter sp.]